MTVLKYEYNGVEYPWHEVHDYGTGWEYEQVFTICPMPTSDYALIRIDSGGGFELLEEMSHELVKVIIDGGQ